MQYKVYKVYANTHYFGYGLVAADCASTANEIIQEFKASDDLNEMNSYGWDFTDEEYAIPHLYSDTMGIVDYGIHYCG